MKSNFLCMCFSVQVTIFTFIQVMRSLFFKMVSDPKCYNPRVLRSLSRPVATHVNSLDEDSYDEPCKDDSHKTQLFSQFLHCDLGYTPADPQNNRPHKKETRHSVPHNKVEENLISNRVLDQPKCRQILSDDGQRKITKNMRKVDEIMSVNKNH